MTDFVIDAVQSAARTTIAQALLSPPKPKAALKRAITQRKKLPPAT